MGWLGHQLPYVVTDRSLQTTATVCSCSCIREVLFFHSALSDCLESCSGAKWSRAICESGDGPSRANICQMGSLELALSSDH